MPGFFCDSRYHYGGIRELLRCRYLRSQCRRKIEGAVFLKPLEAGFHKTDDSEPQAIEEKEAWNRAFEVYLRQLDAKKPVIWTGDINCVPTELGTSRCLLCFPPPPQLLSSPLSSFFLDIRNWKTNHNKSAGCTDREIAGLNAQLNPPSESGHKKLLDVWRHLHPDLEGYYT